MDMLEDNSRRKKVLCPIEKNGKTLYWLRLGTAFINKDNSINVYLDAMPMNSKLHLRDWDEKDERRTDASAHTALRSVPLGLPGGGGTESGANEELPF
jgi:hypothetical protein